MINNNIISIPTKALPSADLNLGSTSTSEKVFITSATVSANNSTASAAILLPLPSSGQLAGTAATSGFNSAFSSGNQGSPARSVHFRVVAAGRVVTGTTANFTVRLMYGTSTTVTSNTAIATSGAVSLASLTTNWKLVANCIYDAPSQRINGWFEGQLHTTTVSPTTLSNSLTSVDLTTAGQTLAFVCTGTFGTGSASNTAFLDHFYIILD